MKRIWWFCLGIWLAWVPVARGAPELRLKPTLTSPVTAVAYRPDGKVLVSGQGDGTLRLWNSRSAGELRQWAGHQGQVTTVVYSQDGKFLASRGLLPAVQKGLFPQTRSEIRLWEGERGAQIRTIETDGKSGLAFSPDGRWLAACAEAPTLWPVGPGSRPGRVFSSSRDRDLCYHLAFSPDGRWLLSRGFNKGIDVWDVASGRLDRVLEAKGASLGPLGFHPKGQLVVGTGSRPGGTMRVQGLRVWRAGGGEVLHSFDLRTSASGLEFSPNGRYLAAGTGHGLFYGRPGVDYPTLHLWDAQGGELIHNFSDSKDLVQDIAWSPDSRFLVSAGSHGLTAWEAARGKRSLEYFTNEIATIDQLGFSADGRFLFSTGRDGWTGAWNLGHGERQAQRMLPGSRMVRATPNGERLVFVTDEVKNSPQETRVDWSATFHVRSATDPEVARSFKAHTTSILALELSPNGRDLVSAASQARPGVRGADVLGPLIRWETDTGRQLRILHGENESDDSDRKIKLGLGSHQLRALRWSPSGDQIATGGGDENRGELLLWNGRGLLTLRRGDGETVSDVHPSAIQVLAYSPDGQVLVSGTADGTLQVWQVDRSTWGPRGPRVAATLQGEGEALTALRFLDHRTVVSGDATGAIRLWKIGASAPQVVSRGRGRAIRSLAISPDGKTLASAAADQQVRLWDLENRAERLTLIALTGNDSVLVTPDFHYMATRDSRDLISFAVGESVFPFEQFDLRLNRPDLVLQQLPNPDPRWVEAYTAAVARRFQETGTPEGALGSEERHLPTLRMLAAENLPVSTAEPRLELRLEALDERFELASLHVWVNGVPLFDRKGRQTQGHQAQLAVAVDLGAGKNQIDAAVRNRRGAESLLVRHNVVFDRTAQEEDLYVLAVGVSQYRDKPLKFAAKDAEDIASLFERSRRHRQVHTHLLLDGEATRESILAGRDFLEQAGLNDQVVLFVAGHGVLDEETDNYYYAPYDMDFEEPTLNGINHEELEGLIDGIASRKKLMLLDTCFSGELVNVVDRNPTGEGARGGIILPPTDEEGEDGAGEEEAPTTETLFVDLRRGIGATVISAAGKKQYALETDLFHNGYFTYSIRKGVMTRQADLDGDGRIMASELRLFTLRDVRETTQDDQQPTLRRENLAHDFRVW